MHTSKNLAIGYGFLNLSRAKRKAGKPSAALAELCAAGLLTCTHGKPGEPGATYALAWLPLDNAKQYSRAVREQHAENMRRLVDGDG